MDFHIYGTIKLLLTTTLLLFAGVSMALPRSFSSSNSSQINSNSVLVALLDSHYTELAELVEKALLLETLEEAVGKHNITIFAPRNDALERDLDPDFKRFLLAPGNVESLQKLLLYHIIPYKIGSEEWPSNAEPTRLTTLAAEEFLHMSNHFSSGEKSVDVAKLVHPDSITRPDGVIHGISQLLVPQSVQDNFNRRRNLRSITAVKPEGTPEVDPRTNKSLKKPVKPSSPPVLPIYDAMAACPGLAPAPAPGPGGPHHHFDGETQVKDFIKTLIQYGGYNELADILVNLTSLATEMGRLVSEGYVLTVLAPNDEAMAKLTTDQLSEPGAPEQIMYFHMVPEYQTEESIYNAVRRFGKLNYDTLRLPHKVVAQESDGSVKFGTGDGAAYLFDPDIYIDGRISVQGIDGILFPAQQETKVFKDAAAAATKVVTKPARRGKLLEIGCNMLRAFGQDSPFTTCQ
ncbi:hypothetical protein ACOSQ4_016074 [Xanthoceras sorbifolium]